MNREELVTMAKAIANAYESYEDATGDKVQFCRGAYRGMIKMCKALDLEVKVTHDLESELLTVTVKNGTVAGTVIWEI